MIDYTILGRSPATLSMMLESVHRLHPNGARVRIILNTVVEGELPFAVEGVEIAELTHDQWDHEEDLRRGVPCLCGVYRPEVKRSVVTFFRGALGIATDRYTNLVHPTAELAATAQLGSGVDVGPHVVVGPHTRIGNFVTLNRAATIGHHTALGDFVTVNPGANIAGRCQIGEGVSIGISATVLDGVKVGARSVIGAGALVTDDLPEAVVAFGVPARVMRHVK
ncbi:MAG TPA: acetyltransferase [Xanthomonadales bacterium]|nr:acetyltransferase [Xanthomonadales bacterium]